MVCIAFSAHCGCRGDFCGNVQPDVHCADSDTDAEVVYAAESDNVHYVDDNDIT